LNHHQGIKAPGKNELIAWCLSVPVVLIPFVHDLWVELCRRGKATLSPQQGDLLSNYIDHLLDANQRMNLTRIDTREGAEILHIADALTLLPYLPAGQLQLADVGSGGGVPGIPLAIVRPDVFVTLIESTKKKGAFLSETVEALALTNATVLAERAEDLTSAHSLAQYSGRGQWRGPHGASRKTGASPQPPPRVLGGGADAPVSLRESLDIVTARALAEMSLLVEWCLPLVRVGGKLLAMKGAKVHDELPRAARAIKLLGGGEPILHRAPLPGGEDHIIVEVAKIGPTPPRYPRPTAEARRLPI
jgi:16S rRNA (guanine527-N7)-methyltransferase